MKRVLILATGGTIAGRAKSGTSGVYESGAIDANELIKSIEGLDTLAHISCEQISNIGSQDMDTAVLKKLHHRIKTALDDDKFDGIVVLHGTDTMEESAFYLHLSLKTNKPVVLTGAMRNASSLSSDGALNIYNAVALSATNGVNGVLVAINGEIHAPSEVFKKDCQNVAAFSSKNSGRIGVINYADARFYSHSTDRLAGALNDNTDMASVAVINAGISFNDSLEIGMLKSAIKLGAKGIVLAGVGAGNASKELLAQLENAAQNGIIIVRSSRCEHGDVLENAEISSNSFIASGKLNVAKSRIMLGLAIATGLKFNEIKALFKL